ncbi:MAG: 5'-nucleotidase [Campylobacterota bacterium]|nr:5'-nucleotidase [Campylobacterota bacterium]
MAYDLQDKLVVAIGADIFFDDQDTHLKHTSIEIPSAKVPSNMI